MGATKSREMNKKQFWFLHDKSALQWFMRQDAHHTHALRLYTHSHNVRMVYIIIYLHACTRGCKNNRKIVKRLSATIYIPAYVYIILLYIIVYIYNLRLHAFAGQSPTVNTVISHIHHLPVIFSRHPHQKENMTMGHCSSECLRIIYLSLTCYYCRASHLKVCNMIDRHGIQKTIPQRSAVIQHKHVELHNLILTNQVSII